MIVSGFLGAGKTTFIKELIRHTAVRPVIMENEYGETDLDSRDIKQSLPEQKEMKILEFMEGCVCCTMKDRFVNSVLTIFSGLDPEYLVVEPTGVGRLSNILNNLKPILHGNISLLKPVAVLAPQTYDYNMTEWPELYSDQISNAGTIVLSKVEHEDPAVLEDIASKIREINPDAEIVTEHYSARPDEWWQDLMQLTDTPVEKNIAAPGSPKQNDTAPGTSTDKSAAAPGAQMNKSAAAPGASTDKPFSQISVQNLHFDRPAELIMLLEDCVHGQFGSIARAKGVITAGGEMLRFDLADREYAVTGAEDEKSQCVFIGTDLREKELYRRLGTSPEEEKMRDPVFPTSNRRKHSGESKTITF